MSIKPGRNTFFSIILSSILLANSLQIVNASKTGVNRINLPGEKTTTSVSKGGNTLRRSKAMEFKKTQLSVETTISESPDYSMLKAMSEYLDDYTEPNISKMIGDFKQASFALYNLWTMYLICSNSNTIKSDRNIELIHQKVRSNIEKIIDNNEKVEMYISKRKSISESDYNHLSSVIKKILPYVNTLLSWFENLNKMKIISNESLLEIKNESFGICCV